MFRTHWNTTTLERPSDFYASVCYLGFLIGTKHFFLAHWLLILFKVQIYSCLEYGSHLWRGDSKYHSPVTLKEIQKRAIKLIEDLVLTNSLDSLAQGIKNDFPFLFFINTIKTFVLIIILPTLILICSRHTISKHATIRRDQIRYKSNN